MLNLRMVKDPEEFKYLWTRYWPDEYIYDHWLLRKCFADLFNRENIFIVAENRKKIMGILPLSWIEEKHCYGFFPGETWQGKTWIEHNRIYAADHSTCKILLENVPGPLNLRYLSTDIKDLNHSAIALDEFNYKCFPEQFNYSFDEYRQLFSRQSIKRFRYR